MTGFTYRGAAVSVKIAVSGFLILAIVGLGVAALQVYVRTGLTPQGALLHYRGNEATLQYPMSFRELVEITHAHAFTIPLLVLVLSAALTLSSTSESLKRFVTLALLTGAVLELGLPWLVRYGPGWTVHLFMLTGALLGGGVFVAAGIPLYEMWAPRHARDE
ncbi:MAG TPA: hypothetical protein PLH72_15435 [Vicinamibacterales bacterium]|nr:hypothetical protein [Vicinamibacterales bacterium]